MVRALILGLLLQSGMTAEVITPAKDSGNLPFSISVPQSWLSKGVWPVSKDSEDMLVHTCGPKNTLTLGITKYAGSSLATVLSSFALAKIKHPERYYSIKTPVGQGALVLVPVGKENGAKGAPKDFITGRIYCGNNKVLFYQYSLYDHKASDTDRKLMLSILQTVKLK